jgi:hypothetical protein
MRSSPSTVHDWMQAIRRPTAYRVGNAKLHIKLRTVAEGHFDRIQKDFSN